MSSRVFSVSVSRSQAIELGSRELPRTEVRRRGRAEFSRTRHLLLPALSLLTLSACGGTADDAEAQATSVGEQLSAKHKPLSGEELFDTAFPHTNGRSCATCHVREDHTALTPAHVAALLASNPNDPLFNPIDADDPLAAVPTYEHLKKGLVRVVLNLPDNMDLIDFGGNVVTPPDRTVAVWRGVPTVENTAITAPYQYDGRKGTLQDQAQGAIIDHSQGGQVSERDLDAIAEFQQGLFTSNRAKKVAKKLEKDIPVEDIQAPEADLDDLTPAQSRGRDVYNLACEPCHGGATTTQVVNRQVHDLAFVMLKADGNVLFDSSVQPPKPVLNPQPNNEFLNVGFANFSYLGQIFGDFFGPRFNATVALPQYRYRFYTDGTRSVKQVDLPPVPQTASGVPTDLTPALDGNGAPIFGPNFLPQQFSTDPGRAATTGNPADFEAFDVPELRGIANTAPYFHDNSAETLRDAVDMYSRFILPFFAPLELPATLPPENGGIFPESLAPQQKDDLLEFLQIL
jgi:cytochrome c peroxidase